MIKELEDRLYNRLLDFIHEHNLESKGIKESINLFIEKTSTSKEERDNLLDFVKDFNYRNSELK
jgi:hypothetical protein